MTFQKVCIVGPGAIGGMMAVLLKRGGIDVSALARPAKAAGIKAKGLTLLMAGETLNAPMPAASDPKDLGPQDLVVVTLKSNALVSAAANIAALCGPKTQVVFAMNGLPWWFFEGFGGALAGRGIKAIDPDGVLARTFRTEQTAWAVVNCSVIERPDGVIEHTRAQQLIFGRPDNSARELDDIAAVFQKANYKTTLSPNIRGDIWAKLVVNCAGNPTSALTGALLGQMYDDLLVRECEEGIAAEVRTLGNKFGFETDPDPVRFQKGTLVRTSMLQDLDRARPLELGSIIEAAVEIGEAAGHPMPLTRAILGLTRLRAATAGAV